MSTRDETSLFSCSCVHPRYPHLLSCLVLYYRFWNFLIYRRPLYLQLRRQKYTRWETIRSCVVLSWFRKDPPSSVRGLRTTGHRRSYRRSSKTHTIQHHNKPALDGPENDTTETVKHDCHDNVTRQPNQPSGETSEGNNDDIETPTHSNCPMPASAPPRGRRDHQRSNVTFSEIIQNLEEQNTFTMDHGNPLLLSSNTEPTNLAGIIRNYNDTLTNNSDRNTNTGSSFSTCSNDNHNNFGNTMGSSGHDTKIET